MADLGSTAWFLAIVAGTTALGLAFAYAVSRFGRRDRRLDPVREAATRANYAADERETEMYGGTSNSPEPAPLPPAAPDVTRRSNAA